MTKYCTLLSLTMDQVLDSNVAQTCTQRYLWSNIAPPICNSPQNSFCFWCSWSRLKIESAIREQFDPVIVAIALRKVHSCENFLSFFVAISESFSFHCVPVVVTDFMSDCVDAVRLDGWNCWVKWTCFGRRNFFWVDASLVDTEVIVSAVFVNCPVWTKRVVEEVLHWIPASTRKKLLGAK